MTGDPRIVFKESHLQQINFRPPPPILHPYLTHLEGLLFLTSLIPQEQQGINAEMLGIENLTDIFPVTVRHSPDRGFGAQYFIKTTA